MLKKILIVMILATIALFSLSVVSKWAGNPETHRHAIEQIDDKISTAMKLTATATAVSAGVSLLPDDACTPIASEIAELAKYFLVVLSALYLEKYMLSLTGIISFAVLIPAACAVLGAGILSKRQVFKNIAVKLGVFAIALYLLVPSSVLLSDAIYSTYEVSISETISDAASTSEILITDGSDSLFDKVKNATTQAINYVQKALANFVEALAIMVVTTCIIPILVLIIFVWLVKLIAGMDLTAVSKKLIVHKDAPMLEHK